MSTMPKATPMAFDKDWTKRDPPDFPTHEPVEDKVRADIQYLFNSIRDQFNNFITNEFKASKTDFTPTGSIPDNIEDVQAAVEYVIDQLQYAVTAQLVDGCVDDDKLATDAVTTVKILNGNVTGDKIALAPNGINTANLNDRQVTGIKIALSTIKDENLDDLSVGTNNLKNWCVNANKLDTNAVTETKIKDGEVKRAKIADLAINTDKLDSGAVTSAKIGSGEVKSANIGTGEVKTNNIEDGAVTHAKTTGVQKQHVIVGPVEIASNLWDAETKEYEVTVTGVSFTHADTQKVDWTPADDATWTLVRNYGIRALPITADDTVTMKCEAIPSSGTVTLYFSIFD